MAITERENKRKPADEKEEVTAACAVDRIPGPEHTDGVNVRAFVRHRRSCCRPMRRGLRGVAMTTRTAFHLDCTPIIPACGFNCGRCVGEMKTVFGGTPGVRAFCREGDGVVVEHDADAVTAEQLMDIFRGLPTFFPNHFVPSVMPIPATDT
jgi:hypothetical protein